MKLLIRSAVILVAALSVFVAPSILAAGQELPAPFKVLPKPQEVTLMAGAGLSFGELKSLQTTGSFSRPVTGPLLSSLPGAGPGPGAVVLRLVQAGDVPKSPEGYTLRIGQGRVEIASQGEAGLFYGCQTLEQLLEDARDAGVAIPACKIVDAPAMSYRAIQIDVRHHLDNMRYYYETIDRLARYKINAVIFEIEDKLAFRRQPLLGAPHAFSIEEMAALTAYARERHIDVSPLVQSLGHVAYILKHPQYAHLRENPQSAWVFCPTDPGTYQVIFDMCRDALEATPGSKYLHFGGDETGAIGTCPRCKAFVDSAGVLALNLYWFNKVNEFAQQNGRVAIFWDDMIFDHAGLYEAVHDPAVGLAAAEQAWTKNRPLLDAQYGRFPKDAYYMRWDYSMARQPGNIMALDWYAKSGLNVMICSAASEISPLYPRACVTQKVHTTEFWDDRVQTIRSFIQLAVDKGIDKHLCSAWDDASPHMETYWRPLVASAEYGWSPFGRTQPEFEQAFWHREFGPECASDTALYAELFKASEFWDWSMLKKGSRCMTSPDEKKENIIGLPDLRAPGAWSKENAERLKLAAREITRYETTARQIADLSKKARRNRYHFEILAATNDFQLGPAKLLLALGQCDVAGKTQRAAGLKSVETALAWFDRTWENLKTVYGKTRFYGNPPNTVEARFLNTWPDRPDMAEQRGDLSFLTIPEQLFHPKLKAWMQAAAL